MEIVQDDFTKELSELLLKHNKTIESDKSGVYIVDDDIGTNVMLSKATTGSEDFRNKLILIRGQKTLL